jgi:hypothetical protein
MAKILYTRLIASDRYPMFQSDKRYVRLVVCNYLEKARGYVALFRFQRLETVG